MPTSESPSDLDIQVRAHVLANAALYEQAGRDIDEAYSPEAFWEQDEQQRKAANAPPGMTLEMWRSAGNRAPLIVSRMLEHHRYDRGLPPVDEAARVVLLHWVLTDQACNSAPVKLTTFQDWSIASIEHDLARAFAYDIADDAEWREYVRKALAVMESVKKETATADPDGTARWDCDSLWTAFERIIADLDQPRTIRVDLADDNPATRNHVNHLAAACGLTDRPIITIFPERAHDGHEWRRKLIVQHPEADGPLSIIVWVEGNSARDPVKPEQRQRLREYLLAWQRKRKSQLLNADPIHTLSAALNRFDVALEDTTTATANGREVGPAPHAITLSQATVTLHEAISAALPTALTRNDQSLMAAITTAVQATGWPIDRHNRAQAGGWPYRWEPGEIVPASVLATIGQVRKLLGVFPLRPGYDTSAPAEVLDAVRKVITDWDGVNWAAVRAALEHAGQPQERIDAMTLDDVRQYFAVGQRRIVLALGGNPETAIHTVVAVEPATVGYVKHKRRKRKTGAPAKPLTARQTEAMHLFGEHKGNIAAVAKAMGVDRKTAEQHIQAAHAKLGTQATKTLTRGIATDARGQDVIASDDDGAGVATLGPARRVERDHRR
jgi:DNA-binding CsgD family transcriptional regulator